MIPSLDLNLATRPFRNNTLPWTGLVLGVLLLGAMTYWNVTTYLGYSERHREMSAELGTYDDQMDDLRNREIRADQGRRAHDVASLRIQADKANDVIGLKAFSWTRLFNRMEQVLPYEVRMSSIRPMFRLGSRRSETASEEIDGIPIVVEGVAKTYEAFLDFERQLLDDPHFDRVEPESNVEKEESKEQIFKIRFFYYPEAASEAEPAVEEEGTGEAEPDAGNVTEGGTQDRGEEVEG
jgi:Tfp pilus assembly protein PilN